MAAPGNVALVGHRRVKTLAKRAITKKDLQEFFSKVEQALNTPIPGTPKMPGRVLYVAIPGTGKKSRNVLSRRATQVLIQIERKRRVSSKQLQAALRVNRNVIAGAIHELKQEGFIRSEPVTE